MRHLVISTADRTLAVPLAHIREVLERIDVVRLPRAPLGVIGAAPVAGSVIPVVSLDSDSDAPIGPALVIDGKEGPFAWRVSRVHALREVDPRDVSPLEASRELPFAGVHESDGETVLHVSLDALEPRWFSGAEPTTDLSILGQAQAESRADESLRDEASVIVVRAASELIAIPLPEVFEIQTSESFVRLPVKDSSVVGLSMVRGNPTLALDLARIVGSREPCTGSIVIVVRRPAAPVALRVDAVVGLRRFDTRHDFVPATNRGIADGFVVHGDEGAAPLLIDVGRAVDHVLDNHLQIAPVQRDAADASAVADDERRLLVVTLGKETAAIDADHVERVVIAPEITPLKSKQAPWLVGAVDVGGRVLPVCDVRRAFGSSAASRAPRLVLIRDRFGDVVVALAVDDVESFVSIEASRIEPFGFARGGPASGVVRLAGGRIASMLDPENLLSHPSASGSGPAGSA
jgi:chemotaxis signal transduction protein